MVTDPSTGRTMITNQPTATDRGRFQPESIRLRIGSLKGGFGSSRELSRLSYRFRETGHVVKSRTEPASATPLRDLLGYNPLILQMADGPSRRSEEVSSATIQLEVSRMTVPGCGRVSPSC